MITFRYYVVSLVAVFLALGMGVLAGTSFIPQATVAALKASLNRVDGRNARLMRQIEDQDKRNRQLSSFADGARLILAKDHFRDRAVAIVTMEGVPSEVTDSVAEAFSVAGSSLEGAFELSSKLDASTDARRQQLASALGTPPGDGDGLRAMVVSKLGDGLLGRDPAGLKSLMDADLVRSHRLAGASGPPGPSLIQGSAVVFLAPTWDHQDRPLAEQVLLPLIRILAKSSLVEVGESGSDRLELARLVRDDASIRAVTVDGAEEPAGQAALVLGIEAAAAGRFDHYGAGPGSTRQLPELRP